MSGDVQGDIITTQGLQSLGDQKVLLSKKAETNNKSDQHANQRTNF